MSKARTQPSAKTGLVLKISVALFLLLAVVLYKLNDYFKQEKWFLAQSQLHSQIISTKTAVSSQLNQLKNILSSYETELVESKINWVQLDPFFGIAKAQKSGNNTKITKFIGRSGSTGDRWNAAYLERALSLRKTSNENPITAQLFRDKQGGKYIAITFTNTKGPAIIVVGSADYFQKYFDLNRGGKMTSLLKTTDNVLAAHSEADYVATVSEEASLSTKKYLIEKEEIAGTNLVAVNYISKNGLASGFVIPWTVVGLITGFGFILIGLLYYGLEPIERKVERYRKQEREQIFKETLQENLQGVVPSELSSRPTEKSVLNSNESKADEETVVPGNKSASATFNEAPVDTTVSSSSLMMPLQQALFNLDRSFKAAGVTLEKHINTNLIYDVPYAALIKAFENILKNSIDAVKDESVRKVIVRAYDIEQNMTVIEIKDTGVGLPPQVDTEKLWQPFFTTKAKAGHLGVGLTEALSLVRQAGAELTIEKAEPQGVLVKMIMTNHAAPAIVLDELDVDTKTTFTPVKDLEVNEEKTQKINLADLDMVEDQAAVVINDENELNLDLEKVLALDDIETETAPELKTAMTSTKFKTTAEAVPIDRPQFALQKKDFKVDDFKVSIRRPTINTKGSSNS